MITPLKRDLRLYAGRIEVFEDFIGNKAKVFHRKYQVNLVDLMG